ncbi:hypothetical protein [Shimia aestuarii]|uniref:hypothetical protein n=1 Tax=Shimia aestuarii TaxID=254406 RepID=UPI001FB4F3CB|nr:hypothetical protein [Shimia aestuarii]
MNPKMAKIALFLVVVIILGQMFFPLLQKRMPGKSEEEATGVETAESVVFRFVLGCWVPDGDLARRADETFEIDPATQSISDGIFSATYRLPGGAGSVQITHDNNLSMCSVFTEIPFAELATAAEAYFISDKRLPRGTLFDVEDIEVETSDERLSWTADREAGARREGVIVHRPTTTTGSPVTALTWAYADLTLPVSE